MSSPFSRHSDHLRLAIRVIPNAGRNALDGIAVAADGESFIKARVSAVPEDGKANKALIELFAKALKIPKSSVSILSGETARKKILRIEGDPEDLQRKLDGLLKS
ncbi:DUF167 domain-containing protein [Neorhizobium lilium]|uniref:UPF0235 protein EPK99_21985 n=1 Tax=Neorhizobium lilium TaxID=2503024 RepID=A0A3S3RQ45_9HYPH|nr:DUF167 domain-containing protein [Neorhizobium lilium]RWX75137.1 DUF167 domain-containing protein [Neorhizobium lilium]